MSELDDNHDSGADIDLAGEYVLGTLDPSQRAQFEQDLQTHPQLRRDVSDWQERLSVLNEGIPPIAPPSRVWKKIQSRISPTSASIPILERIGLWRTLSTAMVIVLAVVLVQTFQPQQPVELPTTITLLSNEQSQAGWLVERLDDQGQMTIKALSATHPGTNKEYELWMIPANGQPPKSLGLLALAGTRQFRLSQEQRQILDNSSALAVSVEPTGGSPTGLPTGPVLYQGKLLSL